MTSVEEHRKKIKEHLDEINDAINKGIERKPVTIGLHTSTCAIELLELYLHAINKISIGKIVKHDWFKKPQSEQKIEPLIERKLPIIFPKKQEIYNLIYDIEEKRNSLVYGKSTENQIKEVLETFLTLKEIFKELFENENFNI